MESGRIEPLRALPVHREAQPCLRHLSQCTLIFPLKGIPQTQGTEPSNDAPIFGLLPEAPLKGLGGVWRPLEPWSPGASGGCSKFWRPLDDTGGLNPNRK